MVSMSTALENRKDAGKKTEPDDRVIAKYCNGRKGPVLIVTADTLGGELSGVEALIRVLDILKKKNLRLKGEVVGLTGNIGSPKKAFLDLEEAQTFSQALESLYNNEETQGYNEANEFVDLIEEFEKTQLNKPTASFYLDLKTCPSIPSPYICVNRDRKNLEFAGAFPFPKVVGLDDFVTDHMGFYLKAKAYTGLTFKTGLYGPYATAEIQEAVIWLALIQSGCLKKEDVPHLDFYLENLAKRFGNGEAVTYHVTYRYGIQEDEFFRMVPGFNNFKRINKGEILAYSDGGEILSEWDARIFMPQYHTQGQSGFFIVEE